MTKIIKISAVTLLGIFCFGYFGIYKDFFSYIQVAFILFFILICLPIIIYKLNKYKRNKIFKRKFWYIRVILKFKDWPSDKRVAKKSKTLRKKSVLSWFRLTRQLRPESSFPHSCEVCGCCRSQQPGLWLWWLPRWCWIPCPWAVHSSSYYWCAQPERCESTFFS